MVSEINIVSGSPRRLTCRGRGGRCSVFVHGADMGNRTADRSPMAWQGSLGQMKAHGSRLAQTAGCGCPNRWVELDLDALIAVFGRDHVLWDRRPPCATCGKRGHYMASPGPSTPYRPLRTGLSHDAERREFLRSFGFSRRDLVRIKRMAEATTSNSIPAALNDLDVPYRVGAVMPADRRHSSGEELGEWAGRTLLYWPMRGSERAVWAKRPRGPRKV